MFQGYFNTFFFNYKWKREIVTKSYFGLTNYKLYINFSLKPLIPRFYLKRQTIQKNIYPKKKVKNHCSQGKYMEA